jgi:hypothetical protein
VNRRMDKRFFDAFTMVLVAGQKSQQFGNTFLCSIYYFAQLRAYKPSNFGLLLRHIECQRQDYAKVCEVFRRMNT